MTRRDLPLPGRRARARARREAPPETVPEAPRESETEPDATLTDRTPETEPMAETPWGTPVPPALPGTRTVVEAASAMSPRDDAERTTVDAPPEAAEPPDQTIVDAAPKQRDIPVAGHGISGKTNVDGQRRVPRPRPPESGVGDETVVDRRAAAETVGQGGAADARTESGLPGLPPRPQPDVVFGPIVGADDETGPQPPLPVLMGLLGRTQTPGGADEETLRPRSDRRVHPPISPVLAEALYTPPRPKAKIGLVIPGVIATGLLVIGAVAALIWPQTPGGPQRAPTSGAAPTTAAPANQNAQTISGVTPGGVQVVYKTVEVSTGYFEGTLTLTNGSSDPIPSWTLTFAYPGAYIRNVWGGRLTDPGNEVTIVSDAETSPIAPGRSVEIRFGGGGAPSRPQDCAFGGTPCGF
ncbi:cellulose binding domain-containing protein [Actinocorallia aurea]